MLYNQTETDPSYKGTHREARGRNHEYQEPEICRGRNGLRALMARERPEHPAGTADVIPASALDGLPHADISNGIVSAKVYLPGEGGFYRGTRFDRTGVVAHATFKGQDYGQPWFSSYSPRCARFRVEGPPGHRLHRQRRGGPGGRFTSQRALTKPAMAAAS